MDFTQGIRSYLTRQIQDSLNHLIEGGVVAGITGDVVLEELSLRKNLLRNLLNLPLEYDIARGTAKELRVSIPWARIIAQSQPVVQVTLKTVEILVKRSSSSRHDSPRDKVDNPHQPPSLSSLQPHHELQKLPVKLSPVPPATAPPSKGRRGSAVMPEEQEGTAVGGGDKPKGWLHSLGKKLLMNVMLRVDNLAIRYEEEDGSTVATAYICNVLLNSADPGQDWQPAYNECDPPASPWLFKAVHLDDVTVCLDGRGPRSSSSSSCSGGSSSSKRRHEAPLVDRASFKLNMALDVRDIFQFWGTEGPPLPPSASPSPATASASYFRTDFFSPMSMDGLFLDSPYTVSSPQQTEQRQQLQQLQQGEEDEQEWSLYDGYLPPTFGALCPVLACQEEWGEGGREGASRVPRPTLGPWEDGSNAWVPYGKEDEGGEIRGGEGERDADDLIRRCMLQWCWTWSVLACDCHSVSIKQYCCRHYCLEQGRM